MTENMRKRIIQVITTFFIQGAILFLSAWTIDWLWAWIFAASGAITLIINFIVIPVEVIEERGRKKKDAKKWDKIITAINIIPTLCLYVCCGLDYRFHWTGDLSYWVNLSGLALSFAGSMLFTWSMVSNKFFSTMVRLQNDRQHNVASGGPYKYIRHPGYVGYIFMSVATPVALGTLWALIFSGITCILLIIRTALEDKTLKQELPGYAEYTTKVKYRLMPFIW
ncbi:MAG: isoprenylcysteine carboxylmethyltransferase family protein [Spirochaetales bacterium]|nr:isoprenylcysteine carboxylmethyltransferase family protein [Spirochaetales bacterium]